MTAAQNPYDLSRFTVDYDRWDKRSVQQLLKEVRTFESARLKLSESVAGDLAFDVWQDLYLSLWKARPELLDEPLVRPTHLVSRMVMDEAQQLPDHQELRVHTVNDNVGAALAAIAMEPEMEVLYDRVQEAQKAANELDDLMHQLAQKIDELNDVDAIFKQWTEENDPEEPENQEQASDLAEQVGQLEGEVEDLQGQVSEKSGELDDKLEILGPTIRSSLREAMKEANAELAAMNEASRMCGQDPGALRRLPADKRIEMAKRLNTPKFKKIAELIGPMARLAEMEQKRKVDYMREEIHDVELGNDLTRVLPAKLAQMSDPDEEDIFWAEWIEGKLPQYMMRGTERVAKGGIVYIHDGSSSMSGAKEIWAKAVGLCLLHIARKQNRPMWAIQFGSASELRLDDFHDPKNIDPDTVMDFAEFFFAGGTSFEQPLNVGLDLLLDEHDRTGAIKSDIVFATDGEAYVSDKWMASFKEAQAKLSFHCWGINIGGNKEAEPFYTICDGRVCSIKDLTSGQDVREIFGGI